MRYGNIKYYDIANGSGVRTSLFVSGCSRHCLGCFSPETWDFDYGTVFDDAAENAIIESLKPDYIAGLSILGGEPVESRSTLVPFMKRVKELYPGKEIWVFTGYSWDELRALSATDETVAEMLALTDVLKAGPFVKDMSEAGLTFRGSKNQVLIDMNETRETGKVIWRKEHDRH